MNTDRMKGLGGLIAMTQSRKGTAFISATIILLVGGLYGNMDTETSLTIAGLAFSYISGQSFVDSKNAVVTIGAAIDSVIPGDDKPQALG